MEDIIEMVTDDLGGHDEVEEEVGRAVAQRKQVHHLVTIPINHLMTTILKKYPYCSFGISLRII